MFFHHGEKVFRKKIGNHFLKIFDQINENKGKSLKTIAFQWFSFVFIDFDQKLPKKNSEKISNNFFSMIKNILCPDFFKVKALGL